MLNIGVNGRTYRMEIPDHFCRPCGTADKPSTECPNLTNVTHVFVEQLVDKFRTVAINVENDKKKFLEELKADETFKPMEITNLISVEYSDISGHLRKSNKPEEFIHRIFARLVLFSGYLELVQRMLDDLTTVSMEIRDNIYGSVHNLNSKIKATFCQLNAFIEQLGIAKMKKKVCRLAERIKGIENDRDETDFIVTVLMEGEKYVKQSVIDLQSLRSEIESCQYKKCDGRRKLSCGEEEVKDTRRQRSRKARADRKNKRNRRKNKGRKNRKNRDRKNKDRKRNKVNRSSKRTNTLTETSEHRRRHKHKSTVGGGLAN